MRNIARCILLMLAFLASGLTTACSGDSVTGVNPTIAPTNQTAVMTVTQTVTATPNFMMSVRTGLVPLDPKEWSLGLQQIFSDDQHSYTQITAAGAKVPLALIIMGTGGVLSDGVHPGTYEYITDWSPIDAAKHPGVKVDSISNLLIMTTEFINGLSTPQAPKYAYQTVATKDVYVSLKKVFDTNKNVVRFVVTRRVYSISCVANDELMFASPAKGVGGVIQNISRDDGSFPEARVEAVAPVTVKCSMYNTYNAALQASFSSSVQ